MAKATNKLRILLVEDDSLLGMLLGELLEDMGHAVCAIETTEDDAVAAALRDKPDLVVADAWLRVGSGMAAVARMESNGAMPHVLISGSLDRIRALRPGAVMLQKPFSETELARAIDRAMGVAAVV